MALVFFRYLDLGLRLTCISKRGIMGLSLVSIPIILIGFVLMFFGWQLIVFWVPRIDLFYSWGSWKLTFVSKLTVFSITFSHKSRLRSLLFIYAWIKGRRPLQNYYINVFFLEAVVGSNFLKSVCKCSICAAQSSAFF